MFLDEARLAAQLQHPNIAQVYDIGKLGDSYFFTMEYVHGETVRALLQRARSLRREMPLGAILDDRRRRGGGAAPRARAARASTASRSASCIATSRRRT